MLYKLAPVAFIGGSLVDRGGQNPIEAVRHGAVVLVGPHWQNFGDTYGVLIKQPRRHRRAFRRGDRQRRPQAALGRGRARRHAHPRQRRACHHLGRAAAHHRGAAALPAPRGRPGACVLTSRLGGIANPRAALPRSCSPLAALYGWVAAARYWRATPYRSRLPVICVGNFTAGGTGKTPLVIHLCERLKAAGHEPVALTRGYGGRLSGPYWVNANVRRGPRRRRRGAAAGPRRADAGRARPPGRGARAIETRAASRHRHRHGRRPAEPGARQGPDASPSSTAARGLGNGLAMPAGPLRAPLDVPARADRCHRRQRRRARTPPWPSGCGIASPAPVLRASVVPAEEHRLAEGHARRRLGRHRRAAALLCHAARRWAPRWSRSWSLPRPPVAGGGRRRPAAGPGRRHAATLVTTAKDMARLTGAAGLPARLAAASRVLARRTLVFAEPDAERLMSLIDTALDDAAVVSYRVLSPVSSHPRTLVQVEGWIPATSAGMTAVTSSRAP